MSQYSLPAEGFLERRVTRRKLLTTGAKLGVGVPAAWALGTALWPAVANVEALTGSGPPFDFSDAYYLANGINPANILSRVNGMDGNSVIDNQVPGLNFRNVRIINTTGGSDGDGSLFYYVITGMLMPNSFTNDAAGRAALSVAEGSFAYIFPKVSGDPLSPDPGNRRQDNVFDYVNDPRNPLGLWTATFVSYTAAAFNTTAGQQALADMAAKNGRDLDGTPILTSKSDIVGLQKNGFVQLRTRAADRSQGFPWII